MRIRRSKGSRRGLTLLELMLVVAIIAMLASLAIPAISEATRAAKIMRTASDMRHFVNSFETYNLANGGYPQDTLPGEIPANMDGIMPYQFALDTPIGGQWDWDLGQFGTAAAVSIYNDRQTVDVIYAWARLDRALDDGNIGTGRLRIRSNGLMMVLDEGSI